MVELAEQRLHHARLRQHLAVEPDRLGVRNTALNAKPQKPHERQPVAHLIFDLVVGQVVKRAQNQRLEHHDSVDRLAPGTRFAFGIWLAPNPLKRWPEFLPWHHGVDPDQRVLLGVQARVSV
jgi:hypothetical protein